MIVANLTYAYALIMKASLGLIKDWCYGRGRVTIRSLPCNRAEPLGRESILSTCSDYSSRVWGYRHEEDPTHY